jgi:hypothetical protein
MKVFAAEVDFVRTGFRPLEPHNGNVDMCRNGTGD